MSGVCPFAEHKLIPAGSNDPAIKPRVAILHVDAGNAFSLYDYFKNRSGGIESHFHVRSDGVIEQYRSIYFQADANHLANDFAVSIETQGYGPGTWNEAQLKSIKRLLVWLNTEAGIPLRKIDKWNGSGVGYHVQFGSPGYWTPVSKSCPGPERIKQYNSVLLPWMAAGASLDEKPVVVKPKANKVDEGRKSIREGIGQLKDTRKERPKVEAALKILRRGLRRLPEKKK